MAQTIAPPPLAKPRFKTSFKASRTYQPIHTGGKAVLSGDGKWLVSTLNEQALVTELATGVRIQELEGDTSAVTTLSITPTPAAPSSGGFLLTAHRSLALHIYSLPSLSLHRAIPKAHEAPIITCASDPTGTLFATGSSDGIVKVWDAARGHCTHVFKGHGGVISALTFDIAHGGQSGGGTSRARLVSGADDCKIRVWDLRTRECVHVLDGHVSVVRGLQVLPDGRTLVSGGRDQVINVWDLERGVLRRTMPVFESVEAVGVVQVDKAEVGGSGKGKGKAGSEGEKVWIVYSGGEKGVVRLWDLATGDQLASSVAAAETMSAKTHEILDVLYTPATNSLTAVYVDQNFVTRSIPSLAITRQVIGYNDEVIDTAFLTTSSASTTASTSTSSEPSTSTSPSNESHLAVATNSDLIRIYDLKKFNTTLLEGHKDVVLCLATSADSQILISGSKDKTARVWRSTPAQEDASSSPSWSCVGQATGHVESVGAVAVSRKNHAFLVTASQDRTAKIWDLDSLLENADESTLATARAMTTQKIHDKDINSLEIAPNDRLLASGSQDRTAKLFSITHTPKTKHSEATATLNLLGTFKGHKRGVWSVKFSPTDQCLATASGDRTIKLWSLADFSCVKTFEGHSNSVLRVDFMTRGMQLVSAASDGLVKVWNVKDENLATTLDNHEEKIWALSIRSDEKEIVSGGADSVITFWEDVTEIEELERIAENEDRVLKEQDFENYLSIKDYSNAILLALSMDQPKRLLKLFTEVRTATKTDDPASLASITGSAAVDSVLKTLTKPDLRQLLSYIKDWNTIARTSEVAQTVLHAILRFHTAEEVLECLEAPPAPQEEESEEEDEDMDDKEARRKRKSKPKQITAGDVLNALIPYTERHLNRADKMVRESFIVEHLLGMMESFDDEQ